MIFPQRLKKWFDKASPREWATFLQIIFIPVIVECLDLKRIITVCDVMALTGHSSEEVENAIKQPMKDKKHFDLLPEMDLFVVYQLLLVIRFTRNPDENEKRQTGIIVEYFFPGIDLIRQHTDTNNEIKPLFRSKRPTIS